METMQRNVVLLSKAVVEQHFKLLTGLQHLCNFKFSPAASMHLVIVAPDNSEVAAIMVKLFNQTLLADMEMLYIKETVFSVRD